MILFYLLVWVMPLANHRFWGRVGGDFTPLKYLGALCVVYAVCYLFTREQFPSFFGTTQARLFLALYLVAALSYFVSGEAERVTMDPILSFTSFVSLFFVVICVVDSIERLRWTLLTIIGGVAFASLYVLREWQKYHSAYHDLRPGWISGDSNVYSLCALLAVPLAICLFRVRGPLWQRLFLLGCLTATLIGFTLAASRGGLVGLGVALTYLALRMGHGVRKLVIVAVPLTVLMWFAPSSPVKRFLNPTTGDTEAVERREALWRAGWRMVEEHPWSGVGLGNFKPLARKYSKHELSVGGVAHNSYLETAAELGLGALALFVGLLLLTFRNLEKVRRQARRTRSSFLVHNVLGIQASLVGYSVSALFLQGQYQKLFWLLVFLSMCLPTLVPGRSRSKAKRSSAGEGDLILPDTALTSV